MERKIIKLKDIFLFGEKVIYYDRYVNYLIFYLKFFCGVLIIF